MSLYTELVAAGVAIGSHESDLYCEDTPQARAILARHPLPHRNATRFRNAITKTIWIDVPFNFDPWWAQRTAVEKVCK